VSGQKPPKEDVRQTEEKQLNACHTESILTENLEQTYYFSLFFGKKQHFILQTTSYVQKFCCTAKKSAFSRERRQR